MGLVLRRMLDVDEYFEAAYPSEDKHTKDKMADFSSTAFPDLKELPPELSLTVLSHLNATDLCLAACVWTELAHDEILWHGLCQDQWGYLRIYQQQKCDNNFSYRRLYMLLDEGSLTFNADPNLGMDYFFSRGLVRDNPKEIAMFFHSTKSLHIRQIREYLEIRRDVLRHLIDLHNFRNQFLPNALRRLFRSIEAPNTRGVYLQELLESFSKRFCQCNPQLKLSSDTVYILCFSLILLSVDLTSPHVRNKMSKREFIRNVRRAVSVNCPVDDLAGHMYDNIYLRGHVATATA